jgi:glycosyltransferase involved in cell wall biosynthesis
MLDQITPIILTYNEAPNIGRMLERLGWARDIVVVDSFSNDETLEIVSSFPNASVYQRAFDSFAAQWAFALNQTGIKTEWVLGIDADFVLSEELIAELKGLRPPQGTDAYRAALRFYLGGKQLRFSLLPPLTVLYRHRGTTFSEDGHAYRVNVQGNVGALSGTIVHDDRKPLRHWLNAQQGYAQLEADKLRSARVNSLNLADRIRRLRIVAPVAIFCYCLMKGGILDGWAGLYYAMQRSFAELLLSLYLLEEDLQITAREQRGSIGVERSKPAALKVPGESVDAAG